MKSFKKLIEHYLTMLIRPDDRVLEIDPMTELPSIAQMDKYNCWATGDIRESDFRGSRKAVAEWPSDIDYVVANGTVHYWGDIQAVLSGLYVNMAPNTRMIVIYYSSLWRPLINLFTFLGLRKKRPEMNWVSPSDMEGIAMLSGFETVRDEARVLLPLNIWPISVVINRLFAPLPICRLFCLLRIAVLRPKKARWLPPPSVSVVVPTRNERGNIVNILSRIPLMGPSDELIFVEGHSNDATWTEIVRQVKEPQWQKKWAGRIKIAQQTGRGKGDAVRLGFSLAENDVLMILDADLTVPPEELPKFYDALYRNRGEFINGSRLVYPMDQKAMRFFNILGNKFFAAAFSFVLQARFKDTLCGTKVMARQDYLKLAHNRGFFGDFDPFGDFDLILGAVRMGLKVVEVPIRYKERSYGETNISRWRHGALLFRMLIFASKRIRFA